jgi:hypothetical protein
MAYPVKQMFSNNVSTMGMPIEHYELAAKTSEMSGSRILETTNVTYQEGCIAEYYFFIKVQA